MNDVFDAMAAQGAHRILMLNDTRSGLKAIIALDDVTLGPACGGIRSQPYESFELALTDVAKLSQAMTLKCAIAGLDAGGGKTVVIDHPRMNRADAFRALGAYVQELGGLYHCAGDLGTSFEDLTHVAEKTSFCDLSGEDLGAATGVSVVNGIRACAAQRGITDLASLKIAVQGAGLIGESVARAMAAHGAHIRVADVDAVRAAKLAADIGGEAVPADSVLMQDVDIVSPCAIGGVLTPEVVAGLKAWAVCGGANNQLGDASVADQLAARDIGYVPDFLASSGAVILGACRNIMKVDPQPFLAAVEVTARQVLEQSQDKGLSTVEIAKLIARSRIDGARTQRTKGG